jgi:hypothetical protein
MNWEERRAEYVSVVEWSEIPLITHGVVRKLRLSMSFSTTSLKTAPRSLLLQIRSIH